jgi:transcriptional regulator GlxA family with amidase domain
VAVMIVQRFAWMRTAQAKEEVRVPQNYTRNVAIVLYEGVELLDFAGPGEVFAAAANAGQDRGQPAFKVYTVAPARQPIKSQGFVTIMPDYGIDDAPPPDILVIPGGSAQTLTKNERFMSWAGPAMKNAKITLTVCTGAFVPATAGLLDGRNVTTHHGSFDSLRLAAPRVTVIEGKRFVDNGSIITTAGVSAGIDGALHTIARLLGRNVADSTASYMEYHWTPEAYLAASYPYLNPSLDEHGRELQQAIIYEEAKDWPQAEKVYRALIEKYPRDGFGWYGLSGVLQAKGDWDAAIEAGERAAGFGNVRSDALFNVACAYARKGNKDEAFNKLRLAVTAGFNRKGQLEREPDLASLRGDARYKQLVEAQ